DNLRRRATRLKGDKEPSSSRRPEGLSAPSTKRNRCAPGSAAGVSCQDRAGIHRLTSDGGERGGSRKRDRRNRGGGRRATTGRGRRSKGRRQGRLLLADDRRGRAGRRPGGRPGERPGRPSRAGGGARLVRRH